MTDCLHPKVLHDPVCGSNIVQYCLQKEPFALLFRLIHSEAIQNLLCWFLLRESLFPAYVHDIRCKFYC
jgi:hypothetical protein